MSDTVNINRAPVLALWAAVVAERLGFDRAASLTLGQAGFRLYEAFRPGESAGGSSWVPRESWTWTRCGRWGRRGRPPQRREPPAQVSYYAGERFRSSVFPASLGAAAWSPLFLSTVRRSRTDLHRHIDPIRRHACRSAGGFYVNVGEGRSVG